MFYYSIYDKKSKHYGELMSFPSAEPEAVVRWFRDIVMTDNPQNLLKRYPEDFVLVFVGNFDNSTGLFSSEYTPEGKGAPDVIDLTVEASVFFKDKE
jgi:hypothetical protein